MAGISTGKEGGAAITRKLDSMRSREHLGLKILLVVVWLVVLLFGLIWLERSGISFRHVPRELKHIIRSYGAWGPLLVLGLYVARSFVFFVPVTGLTLIVGSIYGPIWGILLNVLGENLTASIAFALGRFLGRRFVREHERGWVKKYDDLLREEGFLTTVFIRALYFPFDLVNYGSSMSGITYQHYALGSFFGLLPAIVTFTVLGDAFARPRGFLVFGLLFGLMLVSVLWLRRSQWVQRRLYSKHVHTNE